MAGGKKTQKALATLDTMPDEIWKLVETHGSVRKIAAELEKRGIESSKTFVHAWLTRDEHKERWRANMKARGTDYAEKSVEVLDKLTEADIAQVPLAREKARGYQWMAERLDPEQWGAKNQQVNIQVNVADAFIQAMREKA